MISCRAFLSTARQPFVMWSTLSIGLSRFRDPCGLFLFPFLVALVVVLADLRDFLPQIGEQCFRELWTAAFVLHFDLAIGAKPHRVFTEAVILNAPTNQEAEMPRHDILLLAAIHPHERFGCHVPATDDIGVDKLVAFALLFGFAFRRNVGKALVGYFCGPIYLTFFVFHESPQPVRFNAED